MRHVLIVCIRPGLWFSMIVVCMFDHEACTYCLYKVWCVVIFMTVVCMFDHEACTYC